MPAMRIAACVRVARASRHSVLFLPQLGHASTMPTSLLWYRAGLPDDLIGCDQVSKIRERFTEAIGAAGWPLGACLFLVTRDTRRGRLRNDDEEAHAVFFSPAAIAAVPHLIAACSAEPAPPPDRACATLLAGEESDWDLLPHEAH